MKKINILLIAFLSLIVSCKSTKGLIMPIKAENLDSIVFVVTRVVVKSQTIEPSDEELIQIFQLLPYAELSDLVYEKKGLVLDTSLIKPDEIANNIEYTVVCDAETEEELYDLPEWEMNFIPETETDQTCTLYFTMDPPEGYLNAQAVLETTQLVPAKKEGKEDKIVPLQSTVSQTFDRWTFKNIFVDQRSCAKLKFNKHLTPTFVENELFDVYKILNSTEDGYINVNVKDLIEIRFNIDDPGNLFFSPAEIYNAKLEYVFSPGKEYMIKYKLKRFSPDSSKWKVFFSIKEIKPKQTK
jgi:hypothetical protein